MDIYLVRHTTPAIQKGICYGQSDLELQSNYQEEITHTCRLLPQEIETIYSSPLMRCQTLADQLPNHVTIDHRLMELNFGDWELKPWDAIDTDAMNQWMKNYVHDSPPKGESFTDLFSRVVSCFEEICSKDSSQVVIVCHAGVIRSILSYVLNISLEDSFKVQLAYGSVTKIKYIQGNFQLEYSNRN